MIIFNKNIEFIFLLTDKASRTQTMTMIGKKQLQVGEQKYHRKYFIFRFQSTMKMSKIELKS